MDIADILKQDYQRFPINPTYSIYAENVYFKDPFTEFRGLDRYKKMIGFISTWFIDTKMDLHDIQRSDRTIKTRWTLHWNTPLPWKPRIAITGRSELQLNDAGLICSHIDYWDTPLLTIVKQHFSLKNRGIS